MTLCLAWRTKGTVQLASDSRVSRNVASVKLFADIGIKVIPFQVRVSHLDERIYDYTWGMCYAGESLSVLSLKESLTQVMGNLQLNPITGKVSFHTLSKHIEKIYAALLPKLHDLFLCSDLPNFFLAGYCPEKDRIEVCKLTVTCDEMEPLLTYTEVLTENDTIDYLGSGADKAKKLFKGFNDIAVVRLINEVAQKVNTVGGSIQQGIFFPTNKNFTMLGTKENVKVDGAFTSKFMIGGLEVIGDTPAFDNTNFTLRYMFNELYPVSDEDVSPHY
jgi:hypothetical protein